MLKVLCNVKKFGKSTEHLCGYKWITAKMVQVLHFLIRSED